MKLAIVCEGRPRLDVANGVKVHAYRTAEALASMGHDVRVASITNKQLVEIPNVDVSTYKPQRYPFERLRSLEVALADWGADCVILNSVYSPPNTRLAMFLRNAEIPYIVISHGGLSRNNEMRRKWKKRPYKHLFELSMLNHALFIWAIADAEDIVAYGTRAPIVSTTSGVDLADPNNSEQRGEIPLFAGIENDLVFGFLGRLDPAHKGLDLAVEGFRRAAVPGSALVLVGPPDRRERTLLRSLAEAGTANIRVGPPLFGRDRDIFLAAIDVFIHTSRWEGFPRAVVEAAAMAKPLLLSRKADTSGLFEVSGSSVTVELNADSIASGFRSFAQMGESARHEMGRRAADVARQEFSWSKMAQQLVDAIANSISEDAGKGPSES